MRYSARRRHDALDLPSSSGLRRQRRARLKQCLECGYDLTGNVSGVCPECGTPVYR